MEDVLLDWIDYDELVTLDIKTIVLHFFIFIILPVVL